MEYDLLKLTLSAPVSFQIFDLSGRLVVQDSADLNGRYLRVWDGLDAGGRLAAPGLYLYQVQVEADVQTTSRQGVVSVAY
ncbi:MAG: T9SS type A sorting domain-containing protein [Candidatus Latescibacteria bacterium]|nr:T9SS type A sorting domain-containing protein [Candidatus Latescibacterota bacterium]